MSPWRIFLFGLLFLCSPLTVFAQESPYSRSYHLYLNLAEKALAKGDERQALFYFETAHAIDPSQELPLHYINLLKRIEDGSVENIPLPEPKPKIIPQKVYSSQPKPVKTQRQVVTIPVQSSQPRTSPVPTQNIAPTNAVFSAEEKPGFAQKPTQAFSETMLDLNDELWGHQPNMILELELNRPVLIRGKNIERFLILTEGVITLERVDRNTLNMVANKRGSTFLHIWDDHGRWTFNIQGVVPVKVSARSKAIEEQFWEQHAEPFRVFYNNDWSSFYQGNSLTELERQNLTFSQGVGIEGPTPYGTFDASADLFKFEESTEIIGKRVGLSDGKIGPFKDFTIRGYDTSVNFSALSVPGRSFRGGAIDAYAFDRNIRYIAFQGQDRASFLFLSPGLFNVRKSYIEGGKLTLFPDENHQYSFNYARGYGEARDTFLKPKVYSVDTKHKFDDLEVAAEVANDTDVFAGLVNSLWRKDDSSLRVNFRDIDKDFYTITGRPISQGEIGSNFVHDWNPGPFRLGTSLDVYQDRQLENPDNPNGVNYSFDTSVSLPLSENSTWSTAVYYVDTPQVISPRRDIRFVNRYSKNFRMFNDRFFNFYVGNMFQRSRFPESLSSEYDRYSVLSGFRLPIFKRLSYYANYDYAWVKEIETGGLTHPNVLETGFDYSRELTQFVYGNFNINYRNEEQSEGNFSFLSGEDSLRGSVGLTYRPSTDFEIFMDGNVRNIWKENPTQIAFNDAEVRLGMRSAWDLPFRWDPSGTILGKVYKDLNGNAFYDPSEPGLGDIKIRVGKKTLVTNSNGDYQLNVKAQRVKVNLEAESIPQGFAASSPLTQDVVIENKGKYIVNFGLTSRSGIYGVVFYDVNSNQALDAGDSVVPKVKIVLDDKTATKTGVDGTYFFDNIAPGKHRLKLDINSLPLDYLPLTRIETEIEVQEGTTYVFHVPLKKRP